MQPIEHGPRAYCEQPIVLSVRMQIRGPRNAEIRGPRAGAEVVSLLWAGLIVAAVTAVAITAMLLVRRRAPAGSYFEDGDRAAGVFGVLATGFAVLLGFVVFLAFESFDTSRSGAETEAQIVREQFETAQLFPVAVRARLSGELVCYARTVVHSEWPKMRAGTLGDTVNPWTPRDVPHHQDRGATLSLRAGGLREMARPALRPRGLRGRDRTHGAEGVIPLPLWIVLLLSAVIIFVFMLFFADSAERAVVQATMMGGVAIVITSTLLLLWFLDHPYHSGPGGLRPVAMERTIHILDQECSRHRREAHDPLRRARDSEWRVRQRPGRPRGERRWPLRGRVTSVLRPPTERLLKKYVPVLGWLPGYDRRWLAADFVAGLSVWALLVPQSLAYATIVGVPVQYGLYSAFAALLVYPLFGTSRHLVVGPSATVGAVSAAVVAPLIGTAALGTDEAATYAAALALATACRVPRARPAADGLDLDVPFEGGDVGLHPRVRRRHRDQPAPLPARRARGRRLVCAAALGNDRGDPGYERHDARCRCSVARGAAW